jgi:hypothetical protein
MIAHAIRAMLLASACRYVLAFLPLHQLSPQRMEAARLMVSASTAVLKKNEMIACSVASRRRGLVRIDTSEVCDKIKHLTADACR